MTNTTHNQFFYLKTNELSGNRYDDSDMRFTTPITLDNKTDHVHEMAIIKLQIPTLRMININATTLTIRIATVPYAVPIGVGGYDVGTLRQVINDYLQSQSFQPIDLIPDFSDQRIRLNLPATYRIDFTASTEVARVLGFTGVDANNTAGTDQEVYEAPNQPQFDYFYNQSNQLIRVSLLYLHCNVFNHLSFSNLDTDTIRQNNNSIMTSFGIDTILGSGFVYEPSNSLYMPLRGVSHLESIRFYFTNQDNVLLGGVLREPVFISAHLRARARNS